MARVRLALCAICICLLALSASAVATQHSVRVRHCSGAHKSSFHGSRCGSRHRRHHGSRSHALFFTAVGGRCHDAYLTPTTRNVAEVRAAALCLVNRERARHGEQPLHWNDRLISAAQAHTESMAFGGYFAHSGANGSTPLARMRQFGYIYSSRLGYEVGENIGFGSLWLGTAHAIVAAWMASPGHRANILDGRFRDTGIGVSPHLGRLAPGQSGGLYTQDFGVIVG